MSPLIILEEKHLAKNHRVQRKTYLETHQSKGSKIQKKAHTLIQ